MTKTSSFMLSSVKWLGQAPLYSLNSMRAPNSADDFDFVGTGLLRRIVLVRSNDLWLEKPVFTYHLVPLFEATSSDLEDPRVLEKNCSFDSIGI